MTALTDLTFAQLLSEWDGVSNLFFIGLDSDKNQTVLLNLSILNEESLTSLTAPGVVKAMTRLRELCAKAQTNANSGRNSGEMLDAFPPATSPNTEIVNGAIEQVGIIKSNIVLSSAHNISGPSA